MKGFIAGIAVTAAAVFLALNIHIVSHDDEISFYKKEKMTFDETYIDANNLGPIDWAALPAPVRSGINKIEFDKARKKMKEGMHKMKKVFTD